MPSYLLVHPVLAGSAILLMYGAFFMKSGARKLRHLHYGAGLTALALLTAAVILGIRNTGRYLEQGGTFAWSLAPHFILGLSVLALLIAQATLGALMWRNITRLPRLLRWHRRLAVVLLVVITLQAGLGLWTLGAAMAVPGAVVGAVVLFLALAVSAGVMVWRWQHAFSRREVKHIDTHTLSLPPLSKDAVTIRYAPDELAVRTAPTRTLLQTSLQAGVPHTHICGGNARCSTCRVMIVDGLGKLEQRNSREQTLAERLAFGPEIRLACQTRTRGDVGVRRLVLDENDVELVSQVREGSVPGPVGEEKTLAVLFADIRGFTTFSEGQLPYDVVHALNRYYQAVNHAIVQHGGEINNYMGDGIMALFGMEDNRTAPLDAIKAGLGMLEALDGLRPYLKTHYHYDFDIGIGIHHGNVVIGNIGAPGNKRLTAIGDAVNLASRIEGKTKEVAARLLVSTETYTVVATHVVTGRHVETEVKGKTGLYTLYEITGLAAH